MAARTPNGKIRVSNILLVLLDTNIILDVLLANRNVSKAELRDSKSIWQAVDKGRVVGYISAASLTDIFYIISKNAGVPAAWQAVRVCLQALEICPVDRAILEYADQLAGPDFEDNVQIACAMDAGLDAIITRDRVFYKGSMAVLPPSELLKQILAGYAEWQLVQSHTISR